MSMQCSKCRRLYEKQMRQIERESQDIILVDMILRARASDFYENGAVELDGKIELDIGGHTIKLPFNYSLTEWMPVDED